MTMANTLAYYDTATITAIESFIVLPLRRAKTFLFLLSSEILLQSKIELGWIKRTHSGQNREKTTKVWKER
jgi:hypothetical protein